MYRKRYLRFYILGPTWKMFDVHILSINVDIHYISVLIKYFFSRGKTPWLYEYEYECVCVWKHLAMKHNLSSFSFFAAPQHSCHREHLCNGRSVARLSCWLTVCAHEYNKWAHTSVNSFVSSPDAIIRIHLHLVNSPDRETCVLLAAWFDMKCRYRRSVASLSMFMPCRLEKYSKRRRRINPHNHLLPQSDPDISVCISAQAQRRCSTSPTLQPCYYCFRCHFRALGVLFHCISGSVCPNWSHKSMTLHPKCH